MHQREEREGDDDDDDDDDDDKSHCSEAASETRQISYNILKQSRQRYEELQTLCWSCQVLLSGIA